MPEISSSHCGAFSSATRCRAFARGSASGAAAAFCETRKRTNMTTEFCCSASSFSISLSRTAYGIISSSTAREYSIRFSCAFSRAIFASTLRALGARRLLASGLPCGGVFSRRAQPPRASTVEEDNRGRSTGKLAVQPRTSAVIADASVTTASRSLCNMNVIPLTCRAFLPRARG